MLHYDSNKYAVGEMKKHSMIVLSVDDIMPLLNDFKAGSLGDSIKKSMTLRFLGYLKDIQDERIKVIFMSSNQIREREKKEVDEDMWQIPLFQGQSNISEKDNYIGDTNIFDEDNITIQIHHLRIKGLSVSETPYNETYSMAIHFPERIATQYSTTLKL
jgi:hypothetical protein